MGSLNLKEFKCKLRKDEWSDDNVICDIVVVKDTSGILSAYGTIETSKPLPIDLLTDFISDKPEIFEMWFEEPLDSVPGIKIKITDMEQNNKKRASFESWGALHNKNKN